MPRISGSRSGRADSERPLPRSWATSSCSEDRDSVKTPVSNKEPYFPVDPVFRGEAKKTAKGKEKYLGVPYSRAVRITLPSPRYGAAIQLRLFPDGDERQAHEDHPAR